jgi:hypothetical protein
VSDSILYLAIVGIWAGFLIPAWVRRPHASKYDSDSAEFESEFDTGDRGGDLVAAGPAAPDAMAASTEGLRTDETDYPANTADDTAVDIGAHGHAEVRHEYSEYRDDVHMHSYDSADPRLAESTGLGRPEHRISQSREQMMRARRRMLTILVGLTLLTGFFVLAGLVQWWICVPPLAMLVLYVLLLREIAMADAELAAKRRAWEARQARAAHAATWQRSHEVWEAEAPEPTAEIIDISGRVGDQLYDQYADAAVRAVGD